MDFTDHHAILGVPIDSDPKDVRKYYLQIARQLHPDSFKSDSESDRRQAAEFLSKLVNPAYEKLSNEKTYSEYQVLLRIKGQQAQRQQETVILFGDAARRLAGVSLSDLELCYRAAIKELSSKQYCNLDQTLDVIGQISELNLVYLMRKEVNSDSVTPLRPSGGRATAQNEDKKNAPAPASPPPQRTVLDASLNRAEESEKKGDFAQALLELREASKISPTSSVVQSRLGMIYLKLNQMKMAKIHFDKALKLDPQDSLALEGKNWLEQPGAKVAPGSKPDQKMTAKSNNKGKPDNKSGGGLFGLFGGKKK